MAAAPPLCVDATGACGVREVDARLISRRLAAFHSTAQRPGNWPSPLRINCGRRRYSLVRIDQRGVSGADVAVVHSEADAPRTGAYARALSCASCSSRRRVNSGHFGTALRLPMNRCLLKWPARSRAHSAQDQAVRRLASRPLSLDLGRNSVGGLLGIRGQPHCGKPAQLPGPTQHRHTGSLNEAGDVMRRWRTRSRNSR